MTTVPDTIETALHKMARKYAERLESRMKTRMEEMKADDNAHYLLYRVLGVSVDEGQNIDHYQNKGRFLYQYAGAFLEEATKLCFRDRFPDAKSAKVDNPFGQRPKQFEIDILLEDKSALEIKWRDATTDGDHITKEHNRIKAISQAGYKPIRVMFYYPNRKQAIGIQQALETLYKGVGGEYYQCDTAWEYVKQQSSIDLKAILETIASENTQKWQK